MNPPFFMYSQDQIILAFILVNVLAVNQKTAQNSKYQFCRKTKKNKSYLLVHNRMEFSVENY